MKKQALLILAVALTSQAAHAWIHTGWDRPIYRADLSVLDREGRLPQIMEGAKSVELVMTQQDGAPTPGFVLLIDGQFKQVYDVKSAETDSCHSVTYKLVAAQKSDNYRLDNATETVQVIDHSKRTCLDLLKFRWEMEVGNRDIINHQEEQVRLVGNPRAVLTGQ